jgi:excinuclease ABC subunit A
LRVFSTRRACPSCSRSFAELDPRLFSYNSKHGWCGSCFGTGVAIKGFDAEQTGEEIWWNEWFEGDAAACADCQGRRLNPVALNESGDMVSAVASTVDGEVAGHAALVFPEGTHEVADMAVAAVKARFRGQSIAALSGLPVDAARKFFDGLKLAGREREIARDLLAEIRTRLAFLQDVGLGYISLDRAAPTLSGGEAQRIRLAAQLGSNLRGVCYVLDEPTIGLHPRDNEVLLDTLAKLAAKGNTLLVVEHDEETIRRADHVIDLGPGAGRLGGRIVAQGTADELRSNPDSITGRFLAKPLLHPAHAGARRRRLASPVCACRLV